MRNTIQDRDPRNEAASDRCQLIVLVVIDARLVVGCCTLLNAATQMDRAEECLREVHLDDILSRPGTVKETGVVVLLANRFPPDGGHHLRPPPPPLEASTPLRLHRSLVPVRCLSQRGQSTVPATSEALPFISPLGYQGFCWIRQDGAPILCRRKFQDVRLSSPSPNRLIWASAAAAATIGHS